MIAHGLALHFIFEFPLFDGVSQPGALRPWKWDGPFGGTEALARQCQSRSGPEGAIGRKTSRRWFCFYAGLRRPSTRRERTAESDSSARCVTGACCISKSDRKGPSGAKLPAGGSVFMRASGGHRLGVNELRNPIVQRGV